MLSIAAFGGLLLGAAVSQVILTRYSRRHKLAITARHISEPLMLPALLTATTRTKARC
jgi:hypothetical protein